MIMNFDIGLMLFLWIVPFSIAIAQLIYLYCKKP